MGQVHFGICEISLFQNVQCYVYYCLNSSSELFVAVYVWCDEVRDIRLWPSGFYSESFTDRFVGALSNYDDQNCVDITGQLQNSTLIFSFKLRYRQYLPQIRIAGRDANSVVCKGPVCFNDTHPVIMVHSPADVEPDDNNLFHPASTVCPYRRTVRLPEPNLMRCHFMCRCNRWVDGNGFCDSQFVVVISPTMILPTGNDTMLCGIKERDVYWHGWFSDKGFRIHIGLVPIKYETEFEALNKNNTPILIRATNIVENRMIYFVMGTPILRHRPWTKFNICFFKWYSICTFIKTFQ